MSKIIDLNTFSDGALAERANSEIQKVLENIADPNTDPSKARKLTITIEFKADENRDIVRSSVVAKTTLAPAKKLESKILLDFDRNGKVTGAELKSGMKGQTFITDKGEVAEDNGKIIDLKSKTNN